MRSLPLPSEPGRERKASAFYGLPWLRRIAPALIGMALVGFLFPFFSLVREGREVLRFNGAELALGTTFQPGSPFAAAGKVGPFLPAELALGALAASLALAFWRRLRVAAPACALAGALSLACVPGSFRGAPWPAVMAVMEVRTQSGYYLALVCPLAASVLWLLALAGTREPSST